MNSKIIIINGPNINLLGEREQSQYGSISFENLKTCLDKIKELSMNGEFFQSNIKGEIVNKIQDARKILMVSLLMQPLLHILQLQ